MPAGLFDTLGQPPHPDAAASRPADGDDVGYRAVAGTAIAAAILAFVSPLAFIDWPLVAIPVLGMVLGVVGYRTVVTRPDAYTGRALSLAATAVSLVSLIGGLVTLSLAYAAELPPGYERIHYGLLQPAEGDVSGTLPETARALDGRNVLLKGYMYPGKQQSGITQFLLVRDQGDCCFGGNPKITDRVLVQLRDPDHPEGIAFTNRLTKIAGRFVVRPMGAPGLDGGVIYHLEDARAR